MISLGNFCASTLSHYVVVPIVYSVFVNDATRQHSLIEWSFLSACTRSIILPFRKCAVDRPRCNRPCCAPTAPLGLPAVKSKTGDSRDLAVWHPTLPSPPYSPPFYSSSRHDKYSIGLAESFRQTAVSAMYLNLNNICSRMNEYVCSDSIWPISGYSVLWRLMETKGCHPVVLGAPKTPATRSSLVRRNCIQLLRTLTVNDPRPHYVVPTPRHLRSHSVTASSVSRLSAVDAGCTGMPYGSLSRSTSIMACLMFLFPVDERLAGRCVGWVHGTRDELRWGGWHK